VDTRTELNVLSICSGYGGIELGLDAALAGRTRTICYVENEISVAAILAARMEDGSIDKAPIWTDLTTFQTEPFRGKVDLLCGGFPCQPFSFAGKRLQSADERNLWPDVARIIDGIKPDRVFLENVTGILRYYHERIRRDLRAMGYEVTEGLFSAAETGAPHRRERLFILAHADARRQGEPSVQSETREWRGRLGLDGNELAHAPGTGLQGIRTKGEGHVNTGCEAIPLYPPGPNDHAGWAWLLARWPELAPTVCKESPLQYEMSQIECQFCGSSDGPTQELPTEVLLRGIGNGVVPSVAALGFRELSKDLK